MNKVCLGCVFRYFAHYVEINLQLSLPGCHFNGQTFESLLKFLRLAKIRGTNTYTHIKNIFCT